MLSVPGRMPSPALGDLHSIHSLRTNPSLFPWKRLPDPCGESGRPPHTPEAGSRRGGTTFIKCQWRRPVLLFPFVHTLLSPTSDQDQAPFLSGSLPLPCMQVPHRRGKQRGSTYCQNGEDARAESGTRVQNAKCEAQETGSREPRAIVTEDGLQQWLTNSLRICTTQKAW